MTGDSQSAFSVCVAAGDLVSTLRQAIKLAKSPDLDYLSASSLRLWNVDDSSFQENLQDLTFVDELSLPPVRRLSSIFLQPPTEKRIHIVIRAPPPRGESQLSFICLLTLAVSKLSSLN